MAYSNEMLQKINEEYTKVYFGLQNLFLKNVAAGRELNDNPGARNHLLHGSARRLSRIQRALENIFELFPPSTGRPLKRDKLNVEINLHAYVINMAGLFDNWAWAFVLRHNQ